MKTTTLQIKNTSNEVIFSKEIEVSIYPEYNAAIALGFAKHSGVSLKNANFSGEDLSNVDFSGADLRGADFTGATLYDANFKGAQLGGAIFINIEDNFGRAVSRKAWREHKEHDEHMRTVTDESWRDLTHPW